MKTIFKLAAIAAIFTGFSGSANALEFTPHTQTGSFSAMHMEHECPASYGGGFYTKINPYTARKMPSEIAVARLHGGRFLPLPHNEAPAWRDVSKATAFVPLSAAKHFELLPEIPMGGIDSDNKIDEIRLAAAASGHEYVLIYATGKGADWAQFGSQQLGETGLTVSEDSRANESGDAKALLVKSHSGEVIGAVTTFAPDMKTLTEKVAVMTEQALRL